MLTATEPEYAGLPGVFHSAVEAEQFAAASIFAFNDEAARELGFVRGWDQSLTALDVLSGQATLTGLPALAMAYSGHQFGHWSGQLGDGRARLAGEVRAIDGALYELQLKGSGRTPFSRGGDGKATLGSVMREYIVSEAMAALGVPSSRSLSIVTTGEHIQRQVLEPGAILCRAMRSHIRVGTFQFAASSGDVDHIKALADFAVERLYPGAPDDGPERYASFISRVATAQAKLVAKWMSFGFIHGVMNTDNMCVSGETIDYGPCAFMDDFHPGKVFSSIDRRGRYAWNRQPEMAHWNLARLAESLLPLLGGNEDAQVKAAEAAIANFPTAFQTEFNALLSKKFGLGDAGVDIGAFSGQAFKVMTDQSVDFTLFFRRLTQVATGGSRADFLSLFKEAGAGEAWLEEWTRAAGFKTALPDAVLGSMRGANPIIIARNHRVEEAIHAANQGDYQPFQQLTAALAAPYEDRPEFTDFEQPPLPDEVVEQTFCGT